MYNESIEMNEEDKLNSKSLDMEKIQNMPPVTFLTIKESLRKKFGLD